MKTKTVEKFQNIRFQREVIGMYMHHVNIWEVVDGNTTPFGEEMFGK